MESCRVKVFMLFTHEFRHKKEESSIACLAIKYKILLPLMQ